MLINLKPSVFIFALFIVSFMSNVVIAQSESGGGMFTFTKPKAKKELPDSIQKKSAKTEYAMLKKEKFRADSIKAAKKLAASVYTKFPNLPRNASFCGEKVPVEIPAVAEVFNAEFNRYLGARGLISYFLKISNRYSKEFRAAMKRNGVPSDLFYIVAAESGFANRTSSKGAKGFFQFMEDTARDFGLEVTPCVDERLHPVKSADAACRYLRGLYNGLGRWSSAAAAYNMGQGALEAVGAQQGTRDYFRMQLNPETGAYVYRILSIKILMENAKGYGIGAGERAQAVPTVVEKVNYYIPDLKAYANDCGVDYETLKIMNPWLVANYLIPQTGKTYEITLPKYSNQKIVADEMIPVPYFDASSGRSLNEIRDSIKLSFASR